MKIVFTLLLTCLFAYSMSQSNNIKIGNKDFKTILFSDNLTIYLSSCENRDDYLFAGKSVVRYDSMMDIGYLGSYKYVDGFHCQDSIDHSVIEQIKALSSEKKEIHNKISILFSMEDKNKEFIAVFFLFKNKRFKKFAKRANERIIRNYAGEKILMRDFNYHKYAKEFILAKSENKLSLIPVSRSY